MDPHHIDNQSDILGELALALRGHDAWAARQHSLTKKDFLPGFLTYVSKTVPYYQKGGKKTELDEFPLVSRDSVAKRPDLFVCSEHKHNGSELFAKTSGTTGDPLTVYYDLAGWFDLVHRTYGILGEIIPDLRNRAEVGRVGVAMFTNESTRQTVTVPLLSLNCTFFRRYSLQGNLGDGDLIQEMTKINPPLLYGKPSYLRSFAHTTKQLGASVRPLAMLTSGENLFDDVRDHLINQFGCDVYNAYTSAEGGFMAVSCPVGTALHVQEHRVRLEVLTSGGRVRRSGTGELVLTNFSNWAMPLVRYRTGDFGTLHNQVCACGHVGPTLTRLPAREATSFSIPGKVIAVKRIEQTLSRRRITDYQLDQRAAAVFDLKLVPAERGLAWDKVARSLRNDFSRILPNCEIRLSTVQGLSKPGGKIRRFISLSSRQIYCGKSQEQPLRFDTHQIFDVYSLSFSPVSDFLVVAPKTKQRAGRRKLFIWDYAKREESKLIECSHYNLVKSVSFFQSGLLIAGTTDGRKFLGDLDSPRYSECKEIKPFLALAASPDGEVVAIVNSDNSISLWRPSALGSAGQIRLLARVEAKINSIAFTRDCRFFAAASFDGTINLWTTADWQRVRLLKAGSAVRSIDFSPDGDVLAAVGDYEGIQLWDIISGNRLRRVGKLAGDCLAFSPDAKTLAVGCGANVTLWAVWSGRKIGTLPHDGGVATMDFARNARLLATGGETGLYIWNVLPMPET